MAQQPVVGQPADVGLRLIEAAGSLKFEDLPVAVGVFDREGLRYGEPARGRHARRQGGGLRFFHRQDGAQGRISGCCAAADRLPRTVTAATSTKPQLFVRPRPGRGATTHFPFITLALIQKAPGSGNPKFRSDNLHIVFGRVDITISSVDSVRLLFDTEHQQVSSRPPAFEPGNAKGRQGGRWERWGSAAQGPASGTRTIGREAC